MDNFEASKPIVESTLFAEQKYVCYVACMTIAEKIDKLIEVLSEATWLVRSDDCLTEKMKRALRDFTEEDYLRVKSLG